MNRTTPHRARRHRRSARPGRAIATLAVASGALLASACTTHSTVRPDHPAETYDAPGAEPGTIHRDPRSLALFIAEPGAAPSRTIEWADLVERAANADAVLIGETHGHAMGGAVATALFLDLLSLDDDDSGDRSSRAPALSLEFFERDQQAHLDDYLADITDEATFKKRTARSEPSEFGPGNYPPAHKAMVEAAKQDGRPVIAANAARRYVTLAREDSLETLMTLTPTQRRLYTIPGALTEGAYRDRFFDDMASMLAAHMPEVDPVRPGEGDPAMTDAQQNNLDDAAYELIKGYYRAQNVWDATMADSIGVALDQGLAPVVHVVGQFHVEHDGGLLQRLRAIRPGARVLTIVLADDTPARLTPEDTPALRAEDTGRADVVIYVGDPADW